MNAPLAQDWTIGNQQLLLAEFARLKQRLKADGCRAVDALLAPRAVRGHLEAICAATFKASATEDTASEA